MKTLRLFLPVIAAGLTLAARAPADPPSPGGSYGLVDPWGSSRPATPGSARSLAQKKAGQALDAFDKHEWQAAHDLFAEAEQAVHAPTLVLFMARCQDKLGHWLQARVLYQKVIAEVLSADAPPAFVKGHKDGEVELADLERRIPALTPLVTGPGAPGASVTIDGALVPAGRPRELDPGSHTIEVRPLDGPPSTHTITLETNQHLAIPFPVGAATATPASGAASLAAAQPSPAPWWPWATAFGVGAAGLGVFAVTGSLALAKVGDIKSRCQGTLCQAADKSNADAARALGAVATVGVIAGGVGVGTGVVLLIVKPGGSEQHEAGLGRHWSASVWLGRLDVQGEF